MEYIFPRHTQQQLAIYIAPQSSSACRRVPCACVYMAASLGLAHEAAYPPAPAAAAAPYFASPPPAAGDDLVAEFPPPAAATAMVDDYYFQFGEEMGGGARARARALGCGGYCSPPAPAFDNGMGPLSYGGVDCDGRRPMSGPAAAGTGGNGGGRPASSRIGFRTRSEVDVLDDGFKWRKYGKKAVKSSPNPRNYYRCSVEGCGVKKRVERDSDDPRYVVTTYDGVHNHAAPGAAYLCQPPPPRGAVATPFSPPRSASASPAPLVAAPSWSTAFDAWEAQLHAAATAAVAHSSESSY